MTIEQILARLAEIDKALDAAKGEELTALETEARNLMDTLKTLQGEVQTRKQLRANVAAGLVGQVTEKHEADKPADERAFTPASAEYRSAFLKHLRGEEMTDVEKRAFTFLTTNTTAPLPTVMQNRIIDLIGEAHPIVADVYTLNSNATITVPVGKSVTTDAAKTEEGAAAAELELTFEQVTLSGNEYTANVVMSYKMAAMAIPAFENYLISKISERLGAKIASDIVAKIKEKMHADNKVATGVNYANLCAGFGALKRVGAVVVYGTRKGVYNKLVGMVDANKRPIFQQPITAAAAGTLLGATIKFEDAIGDTELLIGDPTKYLQNEIVPVMIEADKDLTNHKYVYSGYTLQEGTLTDDKAFALVAEAAG